MSEGGQAPMRPPRFVQPPLIVERRVDGSIYLRADIAATPKYAHVPDLLRRRARQFPNRAVIAQRARDDAWELISYEALEERSNRVASYLLDAGSGPDTPLLILSGNSIEHAVMLLGAMKARVPVASLSVAYSVMDREFGKLRQVAALIRPAWVFADDAQKFGAACLAIARNGVRCIAREQYDAMIAHPVSAALEASIAAIDDATVAKYILTSGSTGVPKAVVHTQGMLRAQIAAVDAIRQTHDDADSIPISLNWMPWSHVSAGNMSFHENLLEGGTLYLDDGRPLPGLFEQTLRNLREISPTLYGCAPVGYAWLADAMERDPALRKSFFRNLRSMIYGGAALPRPVYDRIQALAVAETGHRVPFMSVYGSTEANSVTLTYSENLASGMIGLPAPGIELKLVPRGERLALRVRGDCVFREYLGQPALAAESFDEEGFFDTGDAAKFLDEADPGQGLVFDGRISEDFKLTTGTWVAGGNVRLNVLTAANKLLADVVICGENRSYLSALAWLNVTAVREMLAQSRRTEDVRDVLARSLARYNAAHPGSSTRIQRLLLLEAPPSFDELSEKGSINARRVMARRADDVERLYAEPADPRVIDIEQVR